MTVDGLKVAPLWRRGAAAAVNAVVFLTPTVAGVGGTTLLYIKYTERRGREVRKWSPPKPSRRWHLVLFGVSVVVEIRIRNSRSPGYRALGLRRIDARTGGPVSMQSALVQSVASFALSRLIRVLFRPWTRRRLERLLAIQAEIEEVQRAHADDRDAIERELRDLFEQHHVSPAAGCLLPLFPLVLVDLSAVLSPLHQTFSERLAGTVVVED